MFNDQFRGGSPRSVAVDGKRALVALMDNVRRSDPAATDQIDLPPLPDPIAVEGVAFVEFAADEQDAARLSGLLRSMGFARCGRHRNRQVTLFQEGDIRIVVNTEKDGFAQVIETAEGTLRLTLNGAENRKSLAGRFLAESFGSSIQHLALGTDDILRTAEAMRTLGFDPLQISGNCYDDLEARLGLDPAMVDRLRGLNILHDRDEGEEFFQFCGHVQGDGFFLEIVERRGGYRGYGAPNAPFRIAAQQREMPPKGMPRR